MEEVQDRGMVVPIEIGELVNGWTYQITKQAFAVDYTVYGVHVEHKGTNGEITEGAVTRGFTSIAAAKKLIEDVKNALINGHDYRSVLAQTNNYLVDDSNNEPITLGTSIWKRVKAPEAEM